MSKTPFMPLWVSDFLGDTLDLDAAEVGAYLLLLMAQWQRGGKSLPNDQVKLQRVARVGRAWPKVWSAVSPYFTEDEDGIYSRRLRLEAHKVDTKREVNSQNGARGGHAKALKNNNAGLADATVSPTRNAAKPEPEPEREEKRQQQPREQTLPDDDPTRRERLLAAMGADPVSGITGPNGTRLGSIADMEEADRWATMGLSLDDQCRLIAERLEAQHRSNPAFTARSFRYFTAMMADFVAKRSAPVPTGQAQRRAASDEDRNMAFLRKVAGQGGAA